MPRLIRITWLQLVVILISCVSTGLASVIISLHYSAVADRKLCAVVLVQDRAYKQRPPTTDAGKNMAKAINDLATALDCR